jgi:hypothetical protein
LPVEIFHDDAYQLFIRLEDQEAEIMQAKHHGKTLLLLHQQRRGQMIENMGQYELCLVLWILSSRFAFCTHLT